MLHLSSSNCGHTQIDNVYTPRAQNCDVMADVSKLYRPGNSALAISDVPLASRFLTIPSSFVVWNTCRKWSFRRSCCTFHVVRLRSSSGVKRSSASTSSNDTETIKLMSTVSVSTTIEPKWNATTHAPRPKRLFRLASSTCARKQVAARSP